MADGDQAGGGQQQDGGQQGGGQQQAAPWHAGIEADTIGFWQNKGYTIDDPKALAANLTKQYRDLEKHIGAPPDRIIRLPEKPDDIAGWNGVYSKLGVPADAKEYDFSGIKRADNSDLPPALADSLRAALLNARVPKDRGADVAKAVVQSLDAARSQEDTILAAKIDAEKAELKRDWGQNFDFNHLKAMEGVRKTGTPPEAVQALEKAVGYKAVMELFRKIGQGTSEDSFHEGSRGPGGNPVTREGAQSRLNELMADPAWGKRLTAGDAATVSEWRALTTQIDGVAA